MRKQADALLAHGQLQPAAASYRRAVELDPGALGAWVNLGFALYELREFADAEAMLMRALTLAPSNADALYLLGAVRLACGDPSAAIASFTRALAARPDFETCRRDLCLAHVQRGEYDAAHQVAAHGLAIDPRSGEMHQIMGNLHHHAGNLAAAIERYRIALSLLPGASPVHANLAKTLARQGDWAGAVNAYQDALRIDPTLADAHVGMGLMLHRQGDLTGAIGCYRKGLALAPEHVDALSNLGAALTGLGECADAELALRTAVALAPDRADVHNNLGLVLCEQGKLDAGIASFERCAEIDPGSAQLRCNLGAAFQRLGRLAEAAEQYRAAMRLDPSYLDAHSNLLFLLGFDGECSAMDYLAEARRYGAKLASRSKPYEAWPACTPGVERRLRLGLVSGDFLSHPVGYFLEDVIRHLDPERFELLAYSTKPLEDALTARLKPRFGAWNSIVGLDDEAAAAQIHADRVDILVDLSGHSAHNRLPVFAWKPAPVQVSWLGYFATTGVPGIDYVIADPVSVPPPHRAHFTEAIWEVPDTRLCLTAPRDGPGLGVAASPWLERGHVTFGCFQAAYKINDRVLSTWARILERLPTCHLYLQNQQMHSAKARDQMLDRLAKFGISREQVRLVGSLPRDAYLAAHSEADMLLDTCPYPGGTTTCEALWMGVPTVTLAGATMLARQGASLLSAAGLADWVTDDEAGYVELALAKAANPRALAQLRLGLREQVLASPVFDAPRFARQLEQALAGMWQERTTSMQSTGGDGC